MPQNLQFQTGLLVKVASSLFEILPFMAVICLSNHKTLKVSTESKSSTKIPGKIRSVHLFSKCICHLVLVLLWGFSDIKWPKDISPHSSPYSRIVFSPPDRNLSHSFIQKNGFSTTTFLKGFLHLLSSRCNPGPFSYLVKCQSWFTVSILLMDIMDKKPCHDMILW